MTITMKVLLLLFFVSCLDTILARKHCKCYMIYPYDRQVTSWRSARRVCQRKGGDLIKIDNVNEDNMVTDLLRTESLSRGQEGWFIGGRYDNGEWRWADGTLMNYSRFPFSRSGDRLTVFAVIFRHPNYAWGHLSPRSSNKMGFICEKNYC